MSQICFSLSHVPSMKQLKTVIPKRVYEKFMVHNYLFQ